MTNLTRSNFQAHPFHLVSPSPWPLLTSASLLTLTTSGVYHHFNTPLQNQAICWNIFYLGWLQSAGNIESLDFLWFLRDYSLEFFYCTTSPLTGGTPSGKLNDNSVSNKLIFGNPGMINFHII